MFVGVEGQSEEVLRTSDGLEKVFRGNRDGSSIAENVLSATEARFVKILVVTFYDLVGMTWELYACVEGMILTILKCTNMSLHTPSLYSLLCTLHIISPL